MLKRSTLWSASSGTLLAVVLCTWLPRSYAATPHWEPSECAACHTAVPLPGQAPGLKQGGGDALCAECHDSDQRQRCAHASDIGPSTMMSGRMTDGYRKSLRDGRVACTTCHDLRLQCLDEHAEHRFTNQAFLRDGPFRDASEQCYRCHAKGEYLRLNPHAPREGCRFCHQPDPGLAVQREPTLSAAAMSMSCTGCHRVGPHPTTVTASDRPSVWAHLVAPPPAMLARIRAAAAAGLSLPLEPGTGKIGCATCHNPHDVDIPDYRQAVDRNVGHKLRREEICGVCHDN